MDIPKLEKNKCSVLVAEYATGNVFKHDLTVFLNGQNEDEVFKIFDDFTKAQDFAMTLVTEKPQFECSIFNDAGQHLITYDKTGERKYNNDREI